MTGAQQHRIGKAWNRHPELPLEISPLFLWPPRPADIARWLLHAVPGLFDPCLSG